MVFSKIRNILIVVYLAGGLVSVGYGAPLDWNGGTPLRTDRPAEQPAPAVRPESDDRPAFASSLRLTEPADGREEGTPRERSPLRDPTEPEPGMRDVVAPIRMGSQGAAAGSGVPQIALKGRIVGPRASAAMVEIDGTLQTLKQGSEWTRPGGMPGLSGITLRVEEITVSEVRIQVMPLDQVIVLR